MQINYDTSAGTIEIRDGLRSVFTVLKVLMALNVFNAAISIYSTPSGGMGFLQVLWLGVAILSVLFLLFLIFRKSAARVLPVDKIVRLKKKRLFGRRHYSFVLKGGKTRDLGKLKDQSDIDSLLAILAQAGIAIPSGD